MHRKVISVLMALFLALTLAMPTALAESVAAAITGVAASAATATSAANVTTAPTDKPTKAPTDAPTAIPTKAPTAKPTSKPTAVPTAIPTVEPTVEPTIEPTVEPTPTPVPLPVKSGDKGELVKLIQTRLCTLGFTYDAADGDFGPLTLTAVKAFQSFVSAHMGINLHYANPDATAEPTAEPDATGEPTTEPTAIPTAEPAATSSTLHFFGGAQPSSATATKAPVAGLIGGATAMPTIAPTAAATPAPTPEPTPYAADGVIEAEGYDLLINGGFTVYYSDLEKGAEGDDVKRLQTRLTSLYYLSDSVDGLFGGNTQSALKFFQKYNGLDETGIADQQTQEKLYSDDAVPTAKPTLAPYGKNSKGNGKSYSKYKLVIDVSDQRVYAFGYENGAYGPLARVMVCSTGTKTNPTPLGTFKGSGPSHRWHYFTKFKCYAQYSWRIKGDILFHSVLFREEDEDTLVSSSVRNLGRRASHGCVRLSVEDAKWVFNNCASGTTVVVQE